MPRSRLFLAAAALAILYVLSPVDAIPDVPGVGWIDDALVSAATLVLGAIERRRARTRTGR